MMGRRMIKKAQEEMVGFALIIIIVAVILLVFLGFSLSSSKKDTVESYEAESFIQTLLQYTTECRGDLEYLPVQKLIFSCYEGEECVNGKKSCEVLNSTLEGILEQGWGVGEESPVKGYELRIISETEEILDMRKGNITGNSKGTSQQFVKGGDTIDIFFTVYY